MPGYGWIGKWGITIVVAIVAFFPGAGSLRAESDLSADQKTKLKQVMEDARKDTDALYGRLRETRGTLFREFGNYDLDDRKVGSLLSQINSIQSDILKRHLRTQKEIRRIMSPEQFETVKKNMHTLPFDRRNRRERPKKDSG